MKSKLATEKWVAKSYQGRHWVQIGNGKGRKVVEIATITEPDDDVDELQDLLLSRALLIAAGPELLTACLKMKEVAEIDLSSLSDRGEELMEEAMRLAVLAVAKALGK